jgi:N-acetylmuramoyl-L-alanine amidase
MKRVILHCSASPNFKKFTIENIRQWHKARGFYDVGYHYVIELDGAVSEGRKEKSIGAHCKGYNLDSIGICLIGSTEFTEAQISSLVSLIQDITTRYPNIEINGHYEFTDKKTCPNFDVKVFCKKYNL